jgi:hypothetical protein
MRKSSLEERKKLLSSFSSDNDVLNGHLMQRFYYTLYVLESFMKDILNGDFRRYEKYLQPLEGKHKAEIESFKQKFFSYQS